MTEKNLLQPVDVVRDENGYWTHPNLNKVLKTANQEFITNAEWVLFKQQQNIETTFICLKDDAPEAVRDAYSEGDIDISGWNPTKPAGAGWFMLSIHDTDNGPVCFWARRLDRLPDAVLQSLGEVS